MGLAREGEGDQSSAARLVEELVSINRDLEVPTPQAWGIPAERWQQLVNTMAEQALASGSPANNPRVPDAGEIVSLYNRVFS